MWLMNFQWLLKHAEEDVVQSDQSHLQPEDQSKDNGEENMEESEELEGRTMHTKEITIHDCFKMWHKAKTEYL